MKYNVGDKFVIEIEQKIEEAGLYKIKGFKPLVFDDYGLDQLTEVEFEEVDWSMIPVDTPILVRQNDTEEWEKRYFARYEDGFVRAFRSGATSWSGDEDHTWPWRQAKLLEEQDGSTKM